MRPAPRAMELEAAILRIAYSLWMTPENQSLFENCTQLVEEHAMPAESLATEVRGMIRKQAPPDVTLRSGGEGNATTASIAAPNVMGSNAPLATDAWMRRRRKLLTLRKLFLKSEYLAVRRQKKIRKKIKKIHALLTLRKLFLKRELLALREQKKTIKKMQKILMLMLKCKTEIRSVGRSWAYQGRMSLRTALTE